MSVGNWRDSNEGLGGGRYPYDINVALVPSALRAIERLSAANIIDSKYEKTARTIREVWEDKALNLFRFDIDQSKAKAALNAYLTNLSISSSIIENYNNIPKEIHAISLKLDGTKVPVINSDFSFNLLYHDQIDDDYLKYVIQALQPFPNGLLMKDVGIIIANPVYDSEYWNIFNQSVSHGTTVWRFQHAMIIIGLERQIKLCNSSFPPDWCNQSSLVEQLKDILCKVWYAIGENSNLSGYGENYSWQFNSTTNKFSPISFYDLGNHDEPNAFELWNFGELVLNQPDCSRPPEVYRNSEMSYNSIYIIFVVLYTLV